MQRRTRRHKKRATTEEMEMNNIKTVLPSIPNYSFSMLHHDTKIWYLLLEISYCHFNSIPLAHSFMFCNVSIELYWTNEISLKMKWINTFLGQCIMHRKNTKEQIINTRGNQSLIVQCCLPFNSMGSPWQSQPGT